MIGAWGGGHSAYKKPNLGYFRILSTLLVASWFMRVAHMCACGGGAEGAVGHASSIVN